MPTANVAETPTTPTNLTPNNRGKNLAHRVTIRRGIPLRQEVVSTREQEERLIIVMIDMEERRREEMKEVEERQREEVEECNREEMEERQRGEMEERQREEVEEHQREEMEERQREELEERQREEMEERQREDMDIELGDHGRVKELNKLQMRLANLLITTDSRSKWKERDLLCRKTTITLQTQTRQK